MIKNGYAFFTEASQMGLTALNLLQLIVKGVANDDDISDWEDDNWDQFPRVVGVRVKFSTQIIT